MKISTILTTTLGLAVNTATAGPVHCYDNGWSIDVTGSPDIFIEVQQFCAKSADEDKTDFAFQEMVYPKGNGNGNWNIEFGFSNLDEKHGDLKHFKGGSHFETEEGGWSAAIDLTWEDAKGLMNSS